MGGFRINGCGTKEYFTRIKCIGEYMCPACKQTRPFYLVSIKNKISVFFIPTVTIQERYGIICGHCEEGKYIEATEMHRLMAAPAPGTASKAVPTPTPAPAPKPDPTSAPKPAPKPKSVQKPADKTCPSCGAPVFGLFCGKCGAKYEPQKTPPAPLSVPPTPKEDKPAPRDNWECPLCGTLNPIDKPVCSLCGLSKPAGS